MEPLAKLTSREIVLARLIALLESWPDCTDAAADANGESPADREGGTAATAEADSKGDSK